LSHLTIKSGGKNAALTSALTTGISAIMFALPSAVRADGIEKPLNFVITPEPNPGVAICLGVLGVMALVVAARHKAHTSK
jgi:hypothetical protein